MAHSVHTEGRAGSVFMGECVLSLNEIRQGVDGSGLISASVGSDPSGPVSRTEMRPVGRDHICLNKWL